MKKTIAILGAFDRFNYGDLLFPIVIEKYIQSQYTSILKDYNIEFFAMRKSDLRRHKGVSTQSIRYLSKKINRQNNNIIIISGGDVLPVRIVNAYLDLLESKFSKYIVPRIIYYLGYSRFESLLMGHFRTTSRFPWIYSKSQFRTENTILYNSVGASSIDKLPNEYLELMSQQLLDCDYISVRDNRSSSNLKQIGIESKISPDSAIIISKMFSMDFLRENINGYIREYVNNDKNYICFQCNLATLKDNEDIIVQQLEECKAQLGVNIVLLPIGLATNHDDLEALNIIADMLKDKPFIPSELNIYDIMYMIANSKLFIGTSLHGNITAISYSIPHFGINKKIQKLDYFLKTWDVKEIDGCVEFDEICDKAKSIIDIDREKLHSNKNYLISLVEQNFKKMFSVFDKREKA